MEIYKITNNINKKIYIGKDTTCDPNYFGSGVFIKKAISKYGRENFTKEIIDFCNDYDGLSLKEKFWIEKYKSEGNSLYNITEGGDGGDTWTTNPNLNVLKKKYYHPILIDGIEYESINSASKNLNIDRSVIRYRLKSYNFQNYLYKNSDINIKNLKFIDKFEQRRKRISINGITYESISEACRLLNKSHDYVLWRLQSKSYSNWIYLSESTTNKEKNCGPIKIKPVSILGCEYNSIADAVRETGIDRQIMRYRIKSEKYTEYFYI